MKVGVLTALLADLPLEKVLEKLKALGLNTVELGTGNYPGDPHCKLSMLEDPAALDKFRQTLADYGFSISALSCHGEPLHPNPEIAEQHREVNRKTILLAEKLGVPVVIDFSGCPGDSDTAKYPNWVTAAWPPHYQELLAWQWEKKVIPYWRERVKFAEDHGVKIAIEMHPGFVVHSPETLLRLREACGENLGANYDPSHMFWQGIDPLVFLLARLPPPYWTGFDVVTNAAGYAPLGFLLVLGMLRSGDPGRTRALWAELLANAPADAAWRPIIADRLARLDALLGIGASPQTQGTEPSPVN